MNTIKIITIFSVTIGFLSIVLGLFISKYPDRGWYLKLPRKVTLYTLVNYKAVKKIIDFMVKDKNSRSLRLSIKLIKDSEANISIHAFYFLKLVSLISVFIVLMLVRSTNIEIIRNSIIAQPAQAFTFFQDKQVEQGMYNITLYNAVLKRVGENVLHSLNANEKKQEVKKAVAGLINSKSNELIDQRTDIFLDTYSKVKKVKLVNAWFLLSVMTAYWIPELFLVLRRLLLSELYKKEVTKLENVFELLGGIPGIRTVDILQEMAKATRIYKKHIEAAIKLFKDKDIALETLRKSVKNQNFSEFIRIIRIYSLVQKETALNIMDRNKKHREDDELMVSEENLDMIEMIAFASIVPIIFELANLFLKPMVDLTYKAFRL